MCRCQRIQGGSGGDAGDGVSRSCVTPLEALLGCQRRASLRGAYKLGGGMSTTVDQNDAAKDASRDVYVIFVGDIEEKWREATVSAGRIMREAGVSDPEKFILEALDHKGGTPVAEF